MRSSSNHYEDLKKRDVEVLFCYEPQDDLSLMQLGTFNNKSLVSVEKQMPEYRCAEHISDYGESSLRKSEFDDVMALLG